MTRRMLDTLPQATAVVYGYHFYAQGGLPVDVYKRQAFPPGARSFLSCFFMLYSTSFHRDGSCLAENFRRGVLPQRKLSGGQSGHVRMAFPISRAGEERSELAISSKVTMPRPENHNFISVSKSITPADSMEYA